MQNKDFYQVYLTILAEEYDQMMDCDVGWGCGNYRAFQNWIERRYVENGPLGEPERGPDAVSECGGGSAAVYWYIIEHNGEWYFQGHPNTVSRNDYYFVSAEEARLRGVHVTNYRYREE